MDRGTLEYFRTMVLPGPEVIVRGAPLALFFMILGPSRVEVILLLEQPTLRTVALRME